MTLDKICFFNALFLDYIIQFSRLLTLLNKTCLIPIATYSTKTNINFCLGIIFDMCSVENQEIWATTFSNNPLDLESRNGVNKVLQLENPGHIAQWLSVVCSTTVDVQNTFSLFSFSQHGG